MLQQIASVYVGVGLVVLTAMALEALEKRTRGRRRHGGRDKK